MAKELGATAPEVFRNFERLKKADPITKDSDGYYNLTTYGQTVLSFLPTISFLSKNKKYFKDHNFGDLPQQSSICQSTKITWEGKNLKAFDGYKFEW